MPNGSPFPYLLDREIDREAADAFGHRDFAVILQNLIESDTHSPPFTIGLLGKWGTGKSSIKSLYLASLLDDRKRNGNKKTRNQRFHTITFNAWRFGGDNIKRALLRHVFLELEGDETGIKDALFRQIQHIATEKRSLRDFLREIADVWLWGLLQIVAVILLAILLLAFVSWIFSVEADLAIAIIVAAAMGMATLIGRALLDPKRFLVRRYSNLTRIEQPAVSAEQYEDLLISQLSEYSAGRTRTGKGRDCERLVIFVDDLDRLSAEEMVSGLDAVRTFMEIPQGQLPKGFGIVFVISCDEDRVADALGDRRRQRGSSELPGAVFSQSDARRYLDRIFQFRLEIPQFPRRDMRNFAMQKLTHELKPIAEDLRKSGVALDAVVDRMIHVNVQTPRNALQILNVFAQSWWVARERERLGAGTDRPGGLHEGAVTRHPISLAALSAMRADFPDFYNDLLQEPSLIARFTDVVIRGRPLTDQSEPVQVVLRKYIVDNKDTEIKPEHRPLRQFITSLQGLRWPDTLQPLLLLSEDPVTRQYGDRARRVYDALVSGDVAGIVVELGRNMNERPLTDQDVQLLQDMQEGLRGETSVLQNNAAAALAALSKRIPENRARTLLTPVTRRLAEAPELRWRVGIEHIGDLLSYAQRDDRREIAGRLAEELLVPDGTMDFRLETGEPPSLDEAVKIVREGCDLILSVRAEDGLDPPTEARVLNWLEHRQIHVGRQALALPFSQLEQWMDHHEASLLPAIGVRYTAMALEALESENVAHLDVDAIVRRCDIVFEQLWIAGEESREQLWRQLNEFVDANTPGAVTLAWTIMRRHVDGPGPVELTAFVSRLAQRLRRGEEEEEEEE